MLQTICYVSSTNYGIVHNDLNHLFHITKRNNIHLNVSGILILKNGNLLQLLEGEKQDVNKMYKKIRKDNRHHNIIQILNTSSSDRLFENYDTGFAIINNRRKLKQLRSYLDWLKKADMKRVNKLIRLLENFIK